MRLDPFGNPLPARLHYKSGRYWYVYRNKWHPKAKDYSTAMREYAAELSPSGGMMKLISEIYRIYEGRVKRNDLSPRSLRAYKLHRERIETAFREFSPNQVKTSHLGAFLDFYYEDKPNSGNIALVVFKAIFGKGVRWGLCDFNPAREIERFTESKRERYLTDAEYQKIYSAAPKWLQLIMDMCYLTGQRIGDVLHIKQGDITPEGIYFSQEKSKKRLEVESTPELVGLVQEIRAQSKVAGVYLFAKSASVPLHYELVRRAFAAARDAAGIQDARIHDIRAKSLTDADDQGSDAQKLAGHSNPSMTKRYLRLRKTDRVQGPAPMLKMAKP